jgi:hypothetical protein
VGDASEQLLAADEAGALEAVDLEHLAIAAYLTGREGEAAAVPGLVPARSSGRPEAPMRLTHLLGVRRPPDAPRCSWRA